MFNQCGACPHCGAPIFLPSVWMAVIPPPPQYTCICRFTFDRAGVSVVTWPDTRSTAVRQVEIYRAPKGAAG